MQHACVVRELMFLLSDCANYRQRGDGKVTMLKQEITAGPRFTSSDEHIGELLGHMHEIADLSALDALSGWDQNTARPEGGSEMRGAQQATLQGVLHERWTAPRLGSLLDELGEKVQQAPYTDADRGLVREGRRGYDRATKLPRALVEEMARVSSASFDVWRRAREQNDFARFAPWLTRMVALQREVADHLGYTETRYDALLDEYEPGSTVSKLDASCLEGHFPVEQQVVLCKSMLNGMGYDFARGQIAQSPHPFTTSFGSPFDVRVTVRPDERYIGAALMAAIHEGGHALYEQGSAPTLLRTPVAGGASMGTHESQWRLWENALGRSEPYWRGQFVHVREVFPEQFAHVDSAIFARALNRVRPSLIRVEADEVTYNLHIIVRYELEKALVNGEVAVESLPGLWNAKYREYLGVEPETDSVGVLQDVHWTSGFGYFPTYTLGNLYAAQIFAALRKAFPDFDDRLAGGDTAFVLEWLRERMYAAGAIYLPEEVMRRVTGELPDPRYFAQYLTSKFEAIYDLPGTV